MYKLCFFVPAAFAEKVKQAVFETGAGRLGNYENCAWQTSGQGQFKPLAAANPFIGSKGQLEHVEELRVELLCTEDNVRNAVAALKQAHPYECPAYDVVKLEDI